MGKKTPHEFYGVYFPSPRGLQFSKMGKLGLGWMFLLTGDEPVALILRYLCSQRNFTSLARGPGSVISPECLCGFCFLKAFHAALEDESENGGFSTAALEPKAQSLLFSALAGKSSHSLLSPSLVSVHTLHTPSLGLSISISGTQPHLEFQTCRCLRHVLMLLLPEEERGGSCPVLPLAGPLLGPLLGEQSPDRSPVCSL